MSPVVTITQRGKTMQINEQNIAEMIIEANWPVSCPADVIDRRNLRSRIDEWCDMNDYFSPFWE